MLVQIETISVRKSPCLTWKTYRQFQTQKQASTYLGFRKGYALSKPSKMPCDSYSTPADQCKVGRKLAKIPGSTCRSCYAKKGMYVFAVVKHAMRKRLKAIRNPQWTAAMIFLIDAQAKRNSTPHFRWHDSGDIQSMKHLCKIVRIAQLMPHITFWIPTREAGLVAKYRKYRDVPENLIIRESTAMINGPIPVASLGKTYSTVHTVAPRQGAIACIAPSQNGECRNCRACWNPAVHCVSYHKH
jgi:hypothetical protein